MTEQKTVEWIILKNLLTNEEFVRRVLPYIKSDYYDNRHEKILFDSVRSFITKYNSLPTKEGIILALEGTTGITEDDFKKATEIVGGCYQSSVTQPECNSQWLEDIAEKWCQEKALHLALVESINILDESNSNRDKRDKGMIPKILQDALAVSFNPDIGHDYIDDAEQRWEYYHKVEKKIPFDLEYFNKITNGGLPIKTLSVILAGCVHPDTKIKIRLRQKNRV